MGFNTLTLGCFGIGGSKSASLKDSEMAIWMVRDIAAAVDYRGEAGLGLCPYIASAIVSAHQSIIEGESVAGNGTTCTVCIPSDVTR
ncbi:hypothetical protein [Pseudomonas fluorescens]|uniref:hypothetical protein n=1 Tax=Pseudomonas fluorescens TaxID=294 RepID=UPI00177E5BAB|nr:hypothetical protein [Pseudomonas fluorescens]